MSDTKTPALQKSDLHQDFADEVFVQEYKSKTSIEGVKVVDLPFFRGEDGYFTEVARLSADGKLESFPDFQVEQISFSLLDPQAIKGWHLHYNQDDIWFMPAHMTMLVGLVDLRKDSPTSGEKVRVVLGSHKCQLLFIPRGVAHGCKNITSKPLNMTYFTNQKFNLDNPDEMRLNWDHFGADFWEVKKG